MTITSARNFALLLGLGGLLAVSAQFACSDTKCETSRSGYFTSMSDIEQNRIETFATALGRQGVVLSPAQNATLARDGQLFGVLRLDRPVKHPSGAVEMPEGWLPEIPEGHPWAKALSPSDDAFYSWFEERIVDARLFDPANPQHVEWANAYLAKVHGGESFVGWSYANASCN